MGATGLGVVVCRDSSEAEPRCCNDAECREFMDEDASPAIISEDESPAWIVFYEVEMLNGDKGREDIEDKPESDDGRKECHLKFPSGRFAGRDINPEPINRHIIIILIIIYKTIPALICSSLTGNGWQGGFVFLSVQFVSVGKYLCRFRFLVYMKTIYVDGTRIA